MLQGILIGLLIAVGIAVILFGAYKIIGWILSGWYIGQ